MDKLSIPCWALLAAACLLFAYSPVPTALASSNPDERYPCFLLPSVNSTYNTDPSQPMPDDCLLLGSLSPSEFSHLLLPDLQTRPPYDLEITVLPDGAHELRLSNTIWNSGTGPLELEGSFNPATSRTRVEQHVAVPGGKTLNHLVGEFIWHAQHDHWHFEEFSVYELWTLAPDGKLDKLVSSSEKISYCVIDTDIVDSQMEGYSSLRIYQGCGKSLQGLSVGWGDTYKSHLDGQSIYLPFARDGFYALQSTANPDAILLEADYENNTGLTYLNISQGKIELLDLGAYFDQRCQEGDGLGVTGIACKK
jgi:Lysyl oxidase